MVKKLIKNSTLMLLVCLFVFCLILPVPLGAYGETGVYRVYVSDAGSDSASGSAEDPLQSMQAALDKIKSEKTQIKGDAEIILCGEQLTVRDKVVVDESYNLNNGTITFTSLDDTVINAGTDLDVSLFEETEINGVKALKIKIAGTEEVRRLYINGEERMVARTQDLNWGFVDSELMSSEEVEIINAKLDPLQTQAQLEFVIYVEWRSFIFRVKDFRQSDEYETVQILNMGQPFHDLCQMIIQNKGKSNMGLPAPGNMQTQNVWLQNDVSFLKEQGSFCFDEAQRILYYIPYEGEKIKTAEIQGATELFEICGTEGVDENGEGNAVKNILFKNLTFKNAGTDFVKTKGLSADQAQCCNWGKVPAHILIKNACNVSFEGCKFLNMLSVPVWYDEGVRNSSVKGCIFYNIGDSAICIGNGDLSSGTLAEERRVINVDVENNVFRNIGTQNRSSAIQVYYTSETDILHNDIYDAQYSGIAFGWGWGTTREAKNENNTIKNNKIGNFGISMYDLGGIYTLGHSQNSIIAGNYIFEQKARYGGIYLDEGSQYWTVKNNAVDNDCDNTQIRWLYINGFQSQYDEHLTSRDLVIVDNYTTNVRYSLKGGWEETITYERNEVLSKEAFYEQAGSIVDNAGLESEYKHLLSFFDGNDDRFRWEIWVLIPVICVVAVGGLVTFLVIRNKKAKQNRG